MGAGGKVIIRDRNKCGRDAEARVVNGRLLVSSDGGSVVVEDDDVESKGFILFSPAVAATKYAIYIPNRTTTISQIDSVLAGSGGPSVTWELKHAADFSAAGTDVITGGATTTSTTTKDTETTLNEPVLISGRVLWLEITAKAGTVDSLHMTIHFDRSL